MEIASGKSVASVSGMATAANANAVRACFPDIDVIAVFSGRQRFRVVTGIDLRTSAIPVLFTIVFRLTNPTRHIGDIDILRRTIIARFAALIVSALPFGTIARVQFFAGRSRNAFLVRANLPPLAIAVGRASAGFGAGIFVLAAVVVITDFSFSAGQINACSARTGLAGTAIGIARTFGVFAAVASAVGTVDARIRLRLIIAAGRFVRRVDFRARFQNARFIGTFFVFVAFRVDRAFRIAAFRHAGIALLDVTFVTFFANAFFADLIAGAILGRFASRFDADAVDLVRFAVAFRAFRRIAFKTVRKLR